RPAKPMLPADAETIPVIALSVLDLPAPFAPIRPTNSPSFTSSERPRTAWMRPYETRRSSTASNRLSPLTAEIRLDHRRIGTDGARVADRDRPTVARH